jgi:hypothetical protein
MPFIYEPKPLKEVFLLATPHHMLSKLAWEIRQFERALADHQQLGSFGTASYCAFNCAVTALHCADWAWSSAGKETQADLAREFKFKLEANERSNLVAFCDAIERQSRDFVACRRIANGSKHMRLERKDHPVSASVEYSPRGEKMEPPVYTVDFLIRDGQESSLALDVFRRMFEFWRDLFERVGFIEPRYIEGEPPSQQVRGARDPVSP